VRRHSLGWASVGGVVGVALAVLMILGPLVPAGEGSSGAHSAFSGASTRPSDTAFTANVTFQGQPAASHTSTGSAITTNFGATFISIFIWNNPQHATVVNKAELTVLFLGATVGTTSNSLQGEGAQTHGQINITSGFSQDKYLFEGIYQVEASLFDQGQAIWNETFYVWVQAPDHLTIVNIALILIGFFEIYQIAALGSTRVARKELGLDNPPKTGSP
jgi:hypothetical protein